MLECSVQRFYVTVIAMFILSVAAASATYGDDFDWPQWRGPDRNGISQETGWNASWPADGPTQLWRKEVGTGYATVSVSNGRLFTAGYDAPSKSDVVYCLDATTGEQIWKYAYATPRWKKQHKGGPAGTPTVDGDSI